MNKKKPTAKLVLLAVMRCFDVVCMRISEHQPNCTDSVICHPVTHTTCANKQQLTIIMLAAPLSSIQHNRRSMWPATANIAIIPYCMHFIFT